MYTVCRPDWSARTSWWKPVCSWSTDWMTSDCITNNDIFHSQVNYSRHVWNARYMSSSGVIKKYCHPSSCRNLKKAITPLSYGINFIYWMILGIASCNFCFLPSVTVLKDHSWAGWENLFCWHWDSFRMERLHGRCNTGWGESSQRGTKWCSLAKLIKFYPMWLS